MRSWLERLYEDAAVGRLGPRNHPIIRSVVETVHLVVVLVRETIRDRLHVRAANLAFWTAVAIVPLLLLGFALTAPLGLTEATRQEVSRLLYTTILSSSVEEVGGVLDEVLASANLRTLGVLGVIGIMGIGSQLFFNAELAYNDIFRTKVRRSRILRFTLFYAGITLGPLLIAAGFVLTGKIGDLPGAPVFSRAVPIVLSAAVLVGSIRLLPCSPVSWRAAIVGGLVSATLFEFAKIGFWAYTDLLGTRDNLTVIYGSVAFLPAFLLWLQLSWLVVLFGVEVAYLTEHRGVLVDDQRRRAMDRHAHRRQPDGFFALALISTICDHFASGAGPMTPAQLTEATGADPRHVAHTVDVLEDLGLLVATDDGGLVPGRPPERIAPAEVLRGWRGLAAPAIRGPATGAVRMGMVALDSALGGGLDHLGRPVAEET